DDRENGGVRTDSKREGERGDCGERGPTNERANGEAKVLAQDVHVVSRKVVLAGARVAAEPHARRCCGEIEQQMCGQSRESEASLRARVSRTLAREVDHLIGESRAKVPRKNQQCGAVASLGPRTLRRHAGLAPLTRCFCRA